MSPERHSADYFGDYRDDWWNRDFLELLVSRGSLRGARSGLDVGCGVGHWSFTLLSVLPELRLTGVDQERDWVDEANARSGKLGRAERFRALQGRAEALPFADGAFDFVTCQTVLIHVADAEQVLREMTRVLAPGGIALIVEPNNLAGIVGDAELSTEEELALFELHLRCERGKAALGHGNSSVGGAVPALARRAGLETMSVCLSDKAIPLLAPYAEREQAVVAAEIRGWNERGLHVWRREEALRYFLAAGGTADRFERLWRSARELDARALERIASHEYAAGGGALMYVVTARKPRP